MKELFFYDPICAVGSDELGNRTAETPAELLAELDYYGIDCALVQYNNFASAGALYGNERIREFIAADTSGRLSGVWCILPEQCHELPEDLFNVMKQNRIAALTLNPFAHRWIPCKMTIGNIMAEAAERKVPILLNYYDRNWEETYRFVEMFPENRVIIHDTSRHGTDRLIRPLMETYPNVYYAISAHWVPEGIRHLADACGSDRILYSSAYPLYNHGSMMLVLKHSTLPDEDIAKIAGGNMKRLIAEAWEK